MSAAVTDPQTPYPNPVLALPQWREWDIDATSWRMARTLECWSYRLAHGRYAVGTTQMDRGSSFSGSCVSTGNST
jgi:hypothetical protein